MQLGEFYLVQYRFNDQRRYFFWFSEVSDGVLTDGSKRVITFSTKLEALSFAKKRKFKVMKSRTTFYDFDIIKKWILPNATIDCKPMLDFWNMIKDISSSVGVDFNYESVKYNKVYNKLFWGSNLPAVTPRGSKYLPKWNDSEKRLISGMFRSGLKIIEAELLPPKDFPEGISPKDFPQRVR